jgi:hypothetical protein
METYLSMCREIKNIVDLDNHRFLQDDQIFMMSEEDFTIRRFFIFARDLSCASLSADELRSSTTMV